MKNLLALISNAKYSESMSHEELNAGPRGIVGQNKYLSDSHRRVSTDSVSENWYIARLINPDSESIDRYAADILMRVLKVAKLKGGAIKVYAMPAASDGLEEISEEDAVAMDETGFFTEGGNERGYLLDVFERQPQQLGALAVEAMIEA